MFYPSFHVSTITLQLLLLPLELLLHAAPLALRLRFLHVRLHHALVDRRFLRGKRLLRIEFGRPTSTRWL